MKHAVIDNQGEAGSNEAASVIAHHPGQLDVLGFGKEVQKFRQEEVHASWRPMRVQQCSCADCLTGADSAQQAARVPDSLGMCHCALQLVACSDAVIETHLFSDARTHLTFTNTGWLLCTGMLLDKPEMDVFDE